ncbi:hypothetical protein FocTR4_00017143 [Fusarium oxysporum f. sp. cubense]|uniref:BAH domain-containing protein n=1 Tax=Fusarium oxysporum f. sp. cubense TaxID=61366 RepID=A0A5C6SHP5_FUSOC|nr:hypothetical protein FocTR4_00017143 [Fusarium oxysporum f. sp. cubense]
MSNGEGSRSVEGDECAECPFMISYATDPSAAAQKRKRDSYDGTGFELANSPFSPTGGPVTDNPMNLYYTVEPRKRWLDLKTYDTFRLNGVKHSIGHFVKVANKVTVEQQKSRSNQETNYTKPGDYWVAHILEIRGSDEHHIYIRVYWMYWPDDLPSRTLIDRKYVQGRQPYHGADELIATNHMEVINVASVTEPAIVKQSIESDNEEPGANIDEKGHKKAAGPKPYVGLFEADLKTQCSPPVWEIRDLRRNGGADDETWTEGVHCLLCGVLVM